jgi:hypothetical protein
MERAAMDCFRDVTAHGDSRDHIPLLEKGIKLTWTLREREDYALLHLMLLEKRGAIEVYNGVGEDGRKRVSDLIVRALRQPRWLPRIPENEVIYEYSFAALIRLYELGVHEEAAKDIFRARFHDMERWKMPEGWAAASLSQWVLSLLTSASQLDTKVERMALVGQAREVAVRAVPLFGGPWGERATDKTCQVRLAGDGRGVRLPDLTSCCLHSPYAPLHASF